MADQPTPFFTLNREDILARVSARAELEAQMEAIKNQMAEHDAWLDALRKILPPGALDALLPSSLQSSPSQTDGGERSSVWRAAIDDALSSATHGLLLREIASHIRESGSLEAKERLVRNPNGLYTAAGRMVDDGQIVRVGDRLYSTDLHARLEAEGTLEEDAHADVMSEVHKAIIAIIRQSDGARPKSIQAALSNMGFGDKVSLADGNMYNILSRMVRKDLLAKSDGLYVLPKENGPFDGGASNGSEAASVFD